MDPQTQPKMSPDQSAAALALATHLSLGIHGAINPPEVQQGDPNAPQTAEKPKKGMDSEIDKKVDEKVSIAMQSIVKMIQEELKPLLEEEQGETPEPKEENGETE